MGRRFSRDPHQKAHERLESWASWIIRYVESSALDAKIVDYSRDLIGGPAGPIIPNVMKPLDILETENAYENQTLTVKYNIQCYYGLIPKSSPKWAAITKGQREHFLKCVARQLYP